MSPILYRLLHSLRRRWGTTVTTCLTVAVLLGLVLTLVSGAHRTLSAPDRYERAYAGGYDVTIDQDGAEPSPEVLAAFPGVETLSSVTFVFGILTPTGADEPVDSLVFTGEVEAVAGTNVIAGREPQPGRVDEFMVSSSFLEQTGARIGDSFDLSTISQDQANAFAFDTADPEGPTTTATVVGVFGGASELQDGYVIALFSDELRQLGDVGLGGGSSIARLTPDTTTADLRAQLDTLPNGSELAIGTPEWVPGPVRSAVRTQGQGLAVLAIFAVAAAVAVLGQELGRQHRVSDAERLALRTIGMTRRQLLADPLARAAVPIVVGAAGSVVVAVASSGQFPTGFVKQIEPEPGVRFDPLVHVVGPLALICLLLAWVTIGLMTADRPRAHQTTPPLVDGFASRLRNVNLSTGMRFAFSGVLGRRWPAASFFGLVIVLGSVIGALTLGANVARLVDEPARWGSAPFDVGTGGAEIPTDVRNVLATDPDIAAVTYYGGVTVSVDTNSLFVAGMQPARGELLPPVLSGRLPQSDDEIVVGEVTARDLDLDVGDEFEVSGPGGMQRLRISGLAVIPSVERGDGIGEGGVVTMGGLSRIDPTARFNFAGVEFRQGADVGAAERLSTLTGMEFRPAAATPDIVNLDRIRLIPLLVAGVLAVFAVLSLTHQLFVSGRQRRRDIGVLKALGANRNDVTRIAHFQATTFSLAVIVLAIPIGTVAGQSAYRVVTNGIGAQDDSTVPLAAIAGSIIVLLILANVVAMLPARRARRLSPALQLNRE